MSVRSRLSSNTNETGVEDAGTERKKLAANTNEDAASDD